jgi:hypothetical protein
MKDTDQIMLSAGESIEYARQYLKQQGDLVRLEAAERISKTTSALITAIVITFIAVLVVIMLSIATGFWLGNLWGSYAKAFFAITGIYALLGVIIYFFKKQLVTNPVLDFTLDAFFDDDDDYNLS